MPGRLTTEDNIERLNIYFDPDVESDQVAGERCGITKSSYKDWRQRNDLPPTSKSFTVDKEEAYRRVAEVDAVDLTSEEEEDVEVQIVSKGQKTFYLLDKQDGSFDQVEAFSRADALFDIYPLDDLLEMLELDIIEKPKE